MGVGSECSQWRFTELNADFDLCPTYPQVLAVPKRVTDAELEAVAAFRSKQRLQVLTWVNPDTHAAILRCAQPLVGITGNHCEADERLLRAVNESNASADGLAMMDARPFANAVANRGRNGGYEDVDRYEHLELTFLNIDNIHVMRRSLEDMHELLRATDRSVQVTLSDVVATGWLSHVGRVLGGASLIVDEVETRKRTVLVHCSDGWDRTGQLCALAQLCLDPFYRTCEGFQALFQKEWNAFGHKCRDRTWGHSAHERSPIIFQFIDTVHQVMTQFPEAFEFNEEFLLRLTDALYSNVYSDFRFNNERERLASREEVAHVSLWHMLLEDTDGALHNVAYDAGRYPGAIKPPLNAVIWVAYFNRWSREDDAAGVVRAGPIVRTRSRGSGSVDFRSSWSPGPGATAGIDMSHRLGLFLDYKPRHQGWLWKEGKRNWKFKHRLFILYDSDDGNSSLVYYEKEKSGALVPKGVIGLRKGGYYVKSPKRPRSEHDWCFRLDVALPEPEDKIGADVPRDGRGRSARTSVTQKVRRQRFSSTGVALPAAGISFAGGGNEMATAKKTVKFILAADTEEELTLWMTTLAEDVGSRFEPAQESSSDEEEQEAEEEPAADLSWKSVAVAKMAVARRRMSGALGHQDAAAAAAAAFAAQQAGGASPQPASPVGTKSLRASRRFSMRGDTSEEAARLAAVLDQSDDEDDEEGEDGTADVGEPAVVEAMEAILEQDGEVPLDADAAQELLAQFDGKCSHHCGHSTKLGADVWWLFAYRRYSEANQVRSSDGGRSTQACQCAIWNRVRLRGRVTA